MYVSSLIYLSDSTIPPSKRCIFGFLPVILSSGARLEETFDADEGVPDENGVGSSGLPPDTPPPGFRVNPYDDWVYVLIEADEGTTDDYGVGSSGLPPEASEIPAEESTCNDPWEALAEMDKSSETRVPTIFHTTCSARVLCRTALYHRSYLVGGCSSG